MRVRQNAVRRTRATMVDLIKPYKVFIGGSDGKDIPGAEADPTQHQAAVPGIMIDRIRCCGRMLQ
jgi:hypothetical protein